MIVGPKFDSEDESSVSSSELIMDGDQLSPDRKVLNGRDDSDDSPDSWDEVEGDLWDDWIEIGIRVRSQPTQKTRKESYHFEMFMKE